MKPLARRHRPWLVGSTQNQGHRNGEHHFSYSRIGTEKQYTSVLNYRLSNLKQLPTYFSKKHQESRGHPPSPHRTCIPHSSSMLSYQVLCFDNSPSSPGGMLCPTAGSGSTRRRRSASPSPRSPAVPAVPAPRRVATHHAATRPRGCGIAASGTCGIAREKGGVGRGPKAGSDVASDRLRSVSDARSPVRSEACSS